MFFFSKKILHFFFPSWLWFILLNCVFKINTTTERFMVESKQNIFLMSRYLFQCPHKSSMSFKEVYFSNLDVLKLNNIELAT